MQSSAAEADPLASIYIGFGERIDQEVLTRLSRMLKVRRRIDHASVAHRRRTLVASIRIRVALIVMCVIVGCNKQVSFCFDPYVACDAINAFNRSCG